MKPANSFLISVVAGLSLMGSGARGQDNAALQTANQDVQSAQSQLNQSRQDYLKAVRISGKDSPQAAAAKAKLDAAHADWKSKMAVRKQLRQQVRGEMLQRHAAHRQHPTTP